MINYIDGTGTWGDTTNDSTTITLDTFTSTDPSNPGLPADVYGLKFDTPDVSGRDALEVHVSFTSSQEPVWGDFYAKDGKTKVGNQNVDVYAFNHGLGTEPTLTTSDFTNWIARPDGSSSVVILVPLPAAAWMGMMTLGGMIAAKKTRHLIAA